MNGLRLVLALSLLLPARAAVADVYKCQGSDGAVKYQPSPCASGRETLVRLPAPPAPAPALSPPASPVLAPPRVHAEGRGRTFTPAERLSIRLPGVPIRAAFQAMADFSGDRLVIDPSIKGDGVFQYEDTEWSSILADMATRHDLVVTVQGGTMTVRRR